MRILLIDDCRETVGLVRAALGQHEVASAGTLKAGKSKLFSAPFDLVLIDVELPDGSGFDFCSELDRNADYRDTVKILITGKDQVPDKVYGFACGADDYVTKPFSVQELSARIDARLRNKNSPRDSSLHYPPFEFEVAFQRCYIIEESEKRDLMLTPTEFRILLALVTKENQPLSRQEIVSTLWKKIGLHIELRGVDSHISHLRKKLNDQGGLLQSVYGKGYCWKRSRKSA